MPRTRLHLRLRPLSADGAVTWISLSGPVPTKSAQKLSRILPTLAFSSTERVRVVLSAGDSVIWQEVWLRALAHVPVRHHDIRFRRRGRRTSDGEQVARGQLDLFGGAR